MTFRDALAKMFQAMPIHLPPISPISRRRFIAGSVAAGLTLATQRWTFATQANLDAHRVALLSDTHIAADPALLARNVNMTDHLRRVCAEVAALAPRPANVLVNGDFAFKDGQSADYAAAVNLLDGVREAGMSVHVALGNHDHRERFWRAVPATKPPVANKHVALVETPRANWLILDSLDITDEVRGKLGADQLTWLARTLDAHASKPALVMVHHNPEIGPAARKEGGVADTAALFGVLSPRRQAKALLYGHSHRWSHDRMPDGLHLINLPATAYVFSPEQPSGWVDALVAEGGIALTLRTLDPKHPWSGQRFNLLWRE